MLPKKLNKLVIIDGYNVIHADDKYTELIDHTPGVTDIYFGARTALIDDVSTLGDSTTDVILVFDGAGNALSDGTPEKIAGISVIFSPTGIEADEVVEKLASEGQREGREVFVVTSDAATQWTVFNKGVTRVSARMFLQETKQVSKELRRFTNSKKTTLANRIDPNIAKELKKWARGDHNR